MTAIKYMEHFVEGKVKNLEYGAVDSGYRECILLGAGTRDELAELGVEEFQVDLPIYKKK